MNRTILGIGTNLGNRDQNIREAVSYLSHLSQIISLSSTIETDALLPENAEPNWNAPFLNCVVYIKTDLSVFQLGSTIKQIEQKMGRGSDYKKWSPRVIDIDIILYNNLVYCGENFIIPHKEAHKRLFVIKPLCEILPNEIHPVLAKNFKEILTDLERNI